MPITLLDILLLVVMLISGLLAMIRGFMREILSIGAWGVAALVTLYTYSRVLPIAKGYFLQRHGGGRRFGRRYFPAHAADRIDHHGAHFRYGARQPGRRARPLARLFVRTRPRPGDRGRRLPVFRMAGARSQPAGV